MRVALDTNILAYAEGLNGAGRRDQALGILAEQSDDEIMVPVQALGELFAVLVRKGRRPPSDARAAVLGWTDAYPAIATSYGVMLDAMELATTHRLALRDSVMLAAAADAGCRHLLSEDLQHGFIWRGVTVRNPFAGTG